MTEAEMAALQPGDVVTGHLGLGFIVTANYGDRVIAVRTVDLTNPREWQRAARRVDRGPDPDRHHATVYERAAWQHDIGKHEGSALPYQFCPRCEMEHPAGRFAHLKGELDDLNGEITQLRGTISMLAERLANRPNR